MINIKLNEDYLLILLLSILTELIQINNKQSQSIIMCDWSVMYWLIKGSIYDIAYPDTQTDMLINKGYWDFIQSKLNYLLIRLINRSYNWQIKRSFNPTYLLQSNQYFTLTFYLIINTLLIYTDLFIDQSNQRKLLPRDKSIGVINWL